MAKKRMTRTLVKLRKRRRWWRLRMLPRLSFLPRKPQHWLRVTKVFFPLTFSFNIIHVDLYFVLSIQFRQQIWVKDKVKFELPQRECRLETFWWMISQRARTNVRRRNLMKQKLRRYFVNNYYCFLKNLLNFNGLFSFIYHVSFVFCTNK